MHRIGSDIKLWHYQLPVSCDLQNQNVEYRYRIFIQGHDSKVPFFGRWLSKDDMLIDEIGKRNTKSLVQYNVFHFPQDLLYFTESIPRSIMFYIKWLLKSVNVSSILKILQQIEEMCFTKFAAKHVREFIAWIVEQVIGPSVSDTQRLYLCVILGHLFHDRRTYFALPYDHKSEKACDRLLDSFNASVHAPFLSPSSLKILEKLASTVVEKSSCPGWLNLAATFYPYFGVQYVVQKIHYSNMKYKYDIKEYQKLTDILLKKIDITDEEKNDHLNLLQTVLGIAPNNEAVVELFDNPDTDQFFTNEAEKEDFFVKIFQDTHYCGTRKGVGAKLIDLLNIPKKLRGKLYRLVNSSLLDFVRSSEELKEEYSKAFRDLLVFDQCLQKSDVVDLLVEIAKSKSIPRHRLLLMILDTSLFREDWHNTTMAHKVKICSTWVITKVVNEMHINSGIDKTTAVYHSIEILMRCSLNTCNNKLAEEVSQKVVYHILRNEENLSVLKAFVSIEKYSTVVQDCYKAHMKEVLEHDKRLIKKSLKILEEHPSSR